MASLSQIQSAVPANEAEVETKILLHILRLLGFSDADRADKPPIPMFFGRERKLKHPDFVLYDGTDRTLAAALLVVEAKTPGASLEDAQNQAKSYATWAGAPFYLCSDGTALVAVQFLPAAQAFRVVEGPVDSIESWWSELYEFLSRGSVVLAKERLSYISLYLPDVENLPAEQFFAEFLDRTENRVRGQHPGPDHLLTPLSGDLSAVPYLSIQISINDRPISDMETTRQLAEGQCVVLEGQPGAGKTTFCKRLAAAIAGQRQELGCVPLYVPLRSGVPSDISSSFSMAASELGIRVFPHLVQQPLSRSKVIVILDGLDEASRSESIASLQDLLVDPGVHSWLIAGRPWSISHLRPVIPSGALSAHVLPLSDRQLLELFAGSLSEESEAEAALAHARNQLGNEVNSPLFALMALRVSHGDWPAQAQSTFDLVARYIDVLFEYFSHPEIRGLKVERDDFHYALARVAHELVVAPTSLRSLKERMSDEGVRPVLVDALINTGLLSSSGGEASFSHAMFQDFGRASNLLQAVRERDERRLSRSRPSSEVYALAREQLTAADREMLIGLLLPSSARVRRRILTLLRGQVLEEDELECVAEVVIDRQMRSHRTWQSAVRTLLQHGELTFLREVLPAVDRHPIRARKLASAILNTDAHHAISTLATLATEHPHSRIAEVFLRVSLENGMADLLPTQLAVYAELEPPARERFLTQLKRPGHLAVPFAVKALEVEQAPAAAIRLLMMATADPRLLTEEAVEAVTRLFEDWTPQTRVLRRAVAQVAQGLKGEPQPEDLNELLARLEEVLQRTPDLLADETVS